MVVVPSLEDQRARPCEPYWRQKRQKRAAWSGDSLPALATLDEDSGAKIMVRNRS